MLFGSNNNGTLGRTLPGCSVLVFAYRLKTTVRREVDGQGQRSVFQVASGWAETWGQWVEPGGGWVCGLGAGPGGKEAGLDAWPERESEANQDGIGLSGPPSRSHRPHGAQPTQPSLFLPDDSYR